MSAATDFWSQRKAKVQAEAEAEIAARKNQEQEAEVRALEEKSDCEILAELDLPDPDTLVDGDDFSAFMAKVVPERIRRRALRKLWLSNPALANLDGLIEYGEDYTDSATVVENMQTAYQVGRGMLKHVMEMAAKEEREAVPDAAGESLNEETAEVDEAEWICPEAGEPMDDDAEPIMLDDREDLSGEMELAATDAARPPARMRFSFGDDRGAAAPRAAEG